MGFNIIVATDQKSGIWKNWILPWHIPEDLKYFAKITSETEDKNKINAVVMWRKTRESIPSNFSPLKNRINCIISRGIKHKNDTKWLKNNSVKYFKSLCSCLAELEKSEDIESIFIIWWESIYNEAIKNEKLDKIYITKIEWDYKCNKFFDWIPKDFKLKSTESLKNKIKFEVYEK